MSNERDPERDQQLPKHTDGAYIQDFVIADIRERMEHGIRKYGTGLQAGNGRSMLQDAYEESLDLSCYLRGMIEEERIRRDEPTVPVRCESVFMYTLHLDEEPVRAQCKNNQGHDGPHRVMLGPYVVGWRT